MNTHKQPQLRGVEDLAERDELRGLRRRAVLDLDLAVLALVERFDIEPFPDFSAK